MKRKFQFWTEDEDAYLKKFFATKTYKQIALDLNRTASSVRGRTEVLGLQDDLELIRWVEDDVNYLHKHHALISVAEMAKALNRSKSSVRAKLHNLGLLVYYKNKAKDGKIRFQISLTEEDAALIDRKYGSFKNMVTKQLERIKKPG